MTSKITRPLLALSLALGMLAAVSAPSHAALSTTDRSAPAPASSESLAVAAAPSTTASDATPAPVAAVAAPVTTAEAPVHQARKIEVRPRLQPRRVASAPREAFASAIVPRGFGGRRGYPCH